ncbi:Smr/MutS family protein [Bartonella sp. WD16.2]|uniref:Smr/MutS family protein n=1 Tax=Bartonella sp. WD16.2 TaxID=1933904 RepID=UPI00099A33B8|nr:Smr/MutS family protein [Bartonella sp. WD16.2]AQX20654.1 DNA-nicking endonuclease, Smr domain [Bartonella sp. WD16.2]
MAKGQEEKRHKLLMLEDSFLWEKVCRTTIPLHDESSPFMREDVENTKHKKLQERHIFSFSQQNQKRLTMVKNSRGMLEQTEKIYFFDRTTHRKIAKGHYSIEACIDLHGFIQDEAYFFLKKFLQSSQQRGLRYVLVITGKGQSHGSNGVLYQYVPYWLSTPIFQYYIHAFEKASRQHGGNGALYVRLRSLYKRK